MPGLFTDEVLGAFAVQAAPGGVGDALKERYEGLIDRVALYEPLVAGQWDDFSRKVIRAAHAAG